MQSSVILHALAISPVHTYISLQNAFWKYGSISKFYALLYNSSKYPALVIGKVVKKAFHDTSGKVVFREDRNAFIPSR